MRVGGSELGDFVPGKHQVQTEVENLATCISEKVSDDCHCEISNFGCYLCDADGGNRFQVRSVSFSLRFLLSKNLCPNLCPNRLLVGVKQLYQFFNQGIQFCEVFFCCDSCTELAHFLRRH